MMLKKCTRLFLVAAAFLPGLPLSAQLYKVDISEKAAHASLIVEGKVTTQKSFWNPAHTMIYTASTLELYKSFKGQPESTIIEVLTHGGTVANDFIEASDLAQLSRGETGVFFLYPNTGNLHSPESNGLLYDIYSSDQGVVRYSIVQNKAYCPFDEYEGIATNFYNKLQAVTGRPYAVINSQYNVESDIASSHVAKQTAGAIISTSPALVNAGALLDPANNVLTITGNGFGANPTGDTSLLFQDGNSGLSYPSFKVPYNSPYIVSWNNTQIQVRVPSRAARGRFAVYFRPGDTTYAPTTLNVGYGVLNATFAAPYGLQEPRLTNINGLGGYSIVYSTNTAGSGVDITTSPIFNTFRRALTTWKEIAGVNFIEATPNTTTTQTINAGDGVNIIELDNTNTGLTARLADGVLATCYSGFSICTSPSNAVAQKTGFDVLIRNSGVSTGSVAFENGPCAPAYANPATIDMETVLLHELGHALNLAHVNEPSEISGSPYNFANFTNPASLMHYAVSYFDARRSPDASAYNGSQYTITPRSLTLGTCGLGSGEMVQLTTFVPANDNCPLSFPTAVTLGGSAYSIDLVHATSNKAVDPQFTAITCTEPRSVTNNVYQAIRTNGVGGNVSFTVTNYATTPAELATACTASTVGTGVRMNIYAVNSCPTGQAFPAPVYCAMITGNGAIGPVSGLQANRNYLLIFEGIRNTKATFTVTLTGTALPLRLLSFTGRNINYTTNELSLTITDAVNVKTVEIERSATGNEFTTLQELSPVNNTFNGTHSITDKNPLKGINYYRVKTTDVDGKITYSDVVKLNVAEKVQISFQPNPFSGFINIKTQTGNNLTVVVTDAVMKRILQTTVNGNAQIPTARFAPGTYFVSVYDADGKLIQVEKMLKN